MPRRKKSKASPAKTEPKLLEIEVLKSDESADVEMPISADDMRHTAPDIFGEEDVKKIVREEVIALEACIDAVAASVVNLERRLDEYLEEATEEALEEEDDEESPPSDSNYNEYVVQEGETLTQIAKKLFGNPGRFNDIAALNYDRYPSLRNNVNSVEEGWVLRLP